MAHGSLPRNARTMLNRRCAPQLPPEIPLTHQAQASSTRTTPLQTATPTEALAPVILRYERYQDNYINSIEDNPTSTTLTGVRQYMHDMYQTGLTYRPSLDQVAPTPTIERPPTTPSPPSTPATPTAACLPPSPTSYASKIYKGTTKHPAISLAILKLAHHNLPTISLASAKNHIPNLHPTDNPPILPSSAPGNLAPHPFLETHIPWPPRADDDDITIAFLPDFYDQGARHAIGFYQSIACPRRGRTVGPVFFTPCREEELRRYGLVEYVWGREGEGVEGMKCVGCKRGVWLERDTVEEYEDWKGVFWVARVVWEGKLELVRGDSEA